jgi:predicted DNA-binding transcriptional regulator AlpA
MVQRAWGDEKERSEGKENLPRVQVVSLCRRTSPGEIIASMSDVIETPLRAEPLAKILPLHPGTILKWAREEKIPHKRLGPRTIVFMPSEIQAWLESKNGRIP